MSQQEPVINDFKHFKGNRLVVSHMEQMVKERADDYLMSMGQTVTVDELIAGTPDARNSAIKLIHRTYDSMLQEYVGEDMMNSNPPMAFYKAAEASLTEQTVGVLSQDALDSTRLLIDLEQIHDENVGMGAYEVLATDKRTREAHHLLRERVATIETNLQHLEELNPVAAGVLRERVFDNMLDHDWVRLASSQNLAAQESAKISVTYGNGVKPGA